MHFVIGIGEREGEDTMPGTLEGSEGFTDVLKVIVIIRKKCRYT